jgi:hypothetical protein
MLIQLNFAGMRCKSAQAHRGPHLGPANHDARSAWEFPFRPQRRFSPLQSQPCLDNKSEMKAYMR